MLSVKECSTVKERKYQQEIRTKKTFFTELKLGDNNNCAFVYKVARVQ